MINPIKTTKAIIELSSKVASNISEEVASSNTSIIQKSATECLENMGRAQVSLSKLSPSVPETSEEVMELAAKIIEGRGMKVHKFACERAIRGGRAIQGFDDLCQDDIRGKCLRDKDGFLKKILMMDKNTNEVTVYDPRGKIIRHYTPDEMNALHEYKYSPDQFHSVFRKKGIVYVPDKAKRDQQIEIIDKLFIHPDKLYETSEETVVYRALQDVLYPEQEAALQSIGSIFVEPSFVSTTRNFETAKRFQRYNPIMEITLPKGVRYLDLDELFNIDRVHWHEQEVFLPRNSIFKITGFDKENGLIKAKYLKQ